MGLDMYLIADRFIWSDNDKIREKAQALEKCPFKVESIRYEVGYWRKANAIHQWFVDNVQDGKDDCGTYMVSTDQLKELLKAVDKALDSESPDKILPTVGGFFFGSTEYDEGYKDDLQKTKEIIEKFLNFKGMEKYELYYHSSW